MLTVALATVTSLLFGTSDYLGGIASRRDSAVKVTARAHVVGVVLFSLALAVFPMSAYSGADIRWGVAAGLSGGLGVTFLYAALAAGRMSVVAPLTAALAGSLPAVWDLARGTQVGPKGLAGLSLAVLATIIVSLAPGVEDEGRKMTPMAVLYSMIAGLGFASGFVSFSFTSPESGLLPLLVARVTSATVLGVLSLVTCRSLRLDPAARVPALGAGVLESVANVTMLSAIRLGPLAVASVLGSLFPVVVIVLARVFLSERLRPLQGAGVAFALIAVILTALA